MSTVRFSISTDELWERWRIPPKTFGALGMRLLIFPDKVYLRLGSRGVYDSLAALTAAVEHPAYGDIYGVAAESAVELYFWDGESWRFLEREFGSMESSLTTAAVFLARAFSTANRRRPTPSGQRGLFGKIIFLPVTP